MKKASITFKQKLGIVEYLRNNSEELSGLTYAELEKAIFNSTGDRITQCMIAKIIKDAEIDIQVKVRQSSNPTRTGMIELAMKHNNLVEKFELLKERFDILEGAQQGLIERHYKLREDHDSLEERMKLKSLECAQEELRDTSSNPSKARHVLGLIEE